MFICLGHRDNREPPERPVTHAKHKCQSVKNVGVKMDNECLSNDRPKCETEIQSIHLSSRKANKDEFFQHFAHSTCIHNGSKCGGCWNHHEFLFGDVPAYTALL